MANVRFAAQYHIISSKGALSSLYLTLGLSFYSYLLPLPSLDLLFIYPFTYSLQVSISSIKPNNVGHLYGLSNLLCRHFHCKFILVCVRTRLARIIFPALKYNCPISLGNIWVAPSSERHTLVCLLVLAVDAFLWFVGYVTRSWSQCYL